MWIFIAMALMELLSMKTSERKEATILNAFFLLQGHLHPLGIWNRGALVLLSQTFKR